MGVLQESAHWQDIGAGVHGNEKEDTGQVDARYDRVVLYDVVEHGGNFLDNDWVESEQELDNVRQTSGFGE